MRDNWGMRLKFDIAPSIVYKTQAGIPHDVMITLLDW